MSESTLKVSIYSPERKLLEGAPAVAIQLPTSEGQIEILPGHASLAGTLTTGVFRLRKADGQEESGFLATGFFQVAGDTVTLMAETLELKGEINLDRAKQAQVKAEKTLQDASLEPEHFRKYQLKLERALIRQQFGSNAN